MKILLDYLFPITAIEPTPAANTAFLKQVLVIGKPKDGTVTEDVVTLATSMTPISAAFGADAAADVQQLFNAGLSRVYWMAKDDLDIADDIVGLESDFFTILVTSDYADADVTAADFGAFEGVVGVASTDDAFLATQAAIANRSAWHTKAANKSKNMFYAFGKLLSNPLAWRNQQYITMPVADDVDTLGEAEALFDDRISFVISDDEFSNRLAFFVAGGKAITAPYIKKNLQVDMQSSALSYIASNQPGYTKTHAALLEDELQKVINEYIDDGSIEAGEVEVELVEDNFVASGDINISEPKALWRVFAEMRATL
jgi:hypothetical protein